MSAACLPTDSRVLAKMKELVQVGVRRVPEMQRHLKHYVENDLFASGNVPPVTDARFWPSSKVVVSCIYNAARQLRYGIFICYCMANMLTYTPSCIFLIISLLHALNLAPCWQMFFAERLSVVERAEVHITFLSCTFHRLDFNSTQLCVF